MNLIHYLRPVDRDARVGLRHLSTVCDLFGETDDQLIIEPVRFSQNDGFIAAMNAAAVQDVSQLGVETLRVVVARMKANADADLIVFRGSQRFTDFDQGRADMVQ